MRLAIASPLPPAPTGIADHTLELAGLLRDHEVELFHGLQDVDQGRLEVPAYPAAQLAARHRERPFDVAVHQMGNGLAHAFVYDTLRALPGLLVLHDLVLHHSRGRMFLESPEALAYAANPADAGLREAARSSRERYAAEVAYCYPGQADRLVAAQLATVGETLPYAYPLFRLPVEASRAVAVHSEAMAAAVREEVPGVPVLRVPMLAERAAVTPAAGRDFRERLGLLPDDLVVGCYGLVTREKRIETVARALVRCLPDQPGLRLLLVGPVADRDALQRMLERVGAASRTVLAGRVAFEELPAAIEAADVVVHLRWPTARETSAALLRVLAQGRPCLVSDLEQQADLPGDAVLRADVADEEGEVTRGLLHLLASPARRARLGRCAAEFVAREHSRERCRSAWEQALALARTAPGPQPRAGWPAHWKRAS